MLFINRKDFIMKKRIIGTIITISAFAVGYSINNIAISKASPEYRVAVVDIQRIVANSSEINALKIEQEKQLESLQNTINKARNEISKEKDSKKVMQLEEKYRNEINEQKIALDTAYNSKLTAIDNKIKTAVVEKARSMNYNIVLPKNTVLFGGDDITEQVSKIMK